MDAARNDYSASCNPALLRAVPPGARTVLDVGCGTGGLGAALKAADPTRRVYGVERHPAAAARAARVLDAVFPLDAERDGLPLEPGSIDCLVYGAVLEHLAEPLDALLRHRPLLRAGGCVLASVPNVGHHSVITALLTNNFQYQPSGLPDTSHLRLFGLATLQKLFLDAGLLPDLVGVFPDPAPAPLLEAAAPLLHHLGLHPGRSAWHLAAAQFVVRGDLLPDPPDGPEEPMTFAVCASDETTLRANLCASPCLQADSPHELVCVRGAPSAADGLDAARSRARHRWVVCVHQDVYLPRGWPRRFRTGLRAAEAAGPVGAAGVYGVRLRGGAAEHVGRVVDRDRLLDRPAPLPAAVDTLDELLLAVPRDAPYRFDASLGFHFYGADLCLAARAHGREAVAVDAPCLHNSRHVDLPPEFFTSGRAFARKWSARLPVATTCAVVDGEWLPAATGAAAARTA